MKRGLLLSVFSWLCLGSFAQTPMDYINQVNIDTLEKTVLEFSGEVSCIVAGNQETIKNRVSNSGNDVAAQYLIEAFNEMGGITVTDDVYSVKGRNVYATQLGTVYPDSIVMICAHYDAVADYCADDNASGTAIVLEAARILSQYQFEKTIVYALWDEEEVGLLGAKHHALQSFNANHKYAAVLNLDMAAHDANNDKVFDIDLNSSEGSIQMKNELVALTTSANLDIIPEVVQPGTDASDHSAFWTYGYPAVLLGESWATNDQNSSYHSSGDRISLFNMSYFHSIAKLAVGYVGLKSGPVQSVSTVQPTFGFVHVYPNPAEQTLNVAVQQESNVQLLDLNGRVVYSGIHQIELVSIDVSAFSNGVYELKLIGLNSNEVIQQKIIKK